MRSSTSTIVTTVAATLALLALGGLGFVYSGAYNVAATEDHTGLTRWLMHTAMERSVAARADDVPAPPAFDDDLIDHGFEHFRAMCVECHGAPGVDRGDAGQGLTPRPPSLSDATEEYDSRALFWITKNGIKLAGMPAYGPTHSDEQIWGLVAFIEQLADMTPEQYARLEAEYAAQRAAAASSGEGDEGHSHAPGTDDHSH